MDSSRFAARQQKLSALLLLISIFAPVRRDDGARPRHPSQEQGGQATMIAIFDEQQVPPAVSSPWSSVPRSPCG